MKKLLTILFVTAITFLPFSIQSLYAQSFQEEDLVINAGIGLGTTFSTFNANFGLPIGAGIEYGITTLESGSIGFGGDVGFVSGSGITMTTFGIRGSYYFTELLELDEPNLDTYAGLGIYYRNFSYENTTIDWGSGAYAAFHVGARYYFSESVGAYAEIGNNWGWFNLGVVLDI